MVIASIRKEINEIFTFTRFASKPSPLSASPYVTRRAIEHERISMKTNRLRTLSSQENGHTEFYDFTILPSLAHVFPAEYYFQRSARDFQLNGTKRGGSFINIRWERAFISFTAETRRAGWGGVAEAQ